MYKYILGILLISSSLIGADNPYYKNEQKKETDSGYMNNKVVDSNSSVKDVYVQVNLINLNTYFPEIAIGYKRFELTYSLGYAKEDLSSFTDEYGTNSGQQNWGCEVYRPGTIEESYECLSYKIYDEAHLTHSIALNYRIYDFIIATKHTITPYVGVTYFYNKYKTKFDLSYSDTFLYFPEYDDSWSESGTEVATHDESAIGLSVGVEYAYLISASQSFVAKIGYPSLGIGYRYTFK